MELDPFLVLPMNMDRLKAFLVFVTEIKLFWFYLFSSYTIAVLGFLTINTLKFEGAFGFGIHMPSYHYEHYLQYIFIPCFFSAY